MDFIKKIIFQKTIFSSEISKKRDKGDNSIPRGDPAIPQDFIPVREPHNYYDIIIHYYETVENFGAELWK